MTLTENSPWGYHASLLVSLPLKKKKGKTKQLKKQAQFTGSGDWITVVLQAVRAGAEARR